MNKFIDKNPLKTIIIAIFAAMASLLLFSCEKDCKTFMCDDGTGEYIEVKAGDNQLYRDCYCIENFEKNWK